MKTTSIRKLLLGMLDNFYNEHREFASLRYDRAYFAGGCITSMLLDEYVNDYDIFFIDKKDADEARIYLHNHLKDLIVAETENAITLNNRFQFILKYTGDAESMIDSFDFEHIKSYMLLSGELVIKNEVYKSIVNKELVYTGSNFPIASLLRTRKYLRKGWTISANNMLHILFDCLGVLRSIGVNYSVNPEIVDNIGEFENSSNIKSELDDFIVNVPLFIEQMSGIDPITIQNQLASAGEFMSLNEIIALLK